MVQFFDEQGLTPKILRSQYEAQVGTLRSLFLEQDFDPKHIQLTHNEPLSRNGGFLSLTSPKAREIKADLMDRNIFTDARNEILRLGPAPYTTTSQIEEMIGELKESVEKIL